MGTWSPARMPNPCPSCGAETDPNNVEVVLPKARHCSRMKQAFTKHIYECQGCGEKKTTNEWQVLARGKVI